jgi:hypothetical protein
LGRTRRSYQRRDRQRRLGPTRPPPQSELGETLKRIAGLLIEHQEALATFDDRLADLPEKIAAVLTSPPS